MATPAAITAIAASIETVTRSAWSLPHASATSSAPTASPAMAGSGCAFSTAPTAPSTLPAPVFAPSTASSTSMAGFVSGCGWKSESSLERPVTGSVEPSSSASFSTPSKPWLGPRLVECRREYSAAAVAAAATAPTDAPPIWRKVYRSESAPTARG